MAKKVAASRWGRGLPWCETLWPGLSENAAIGTGVASIISGIGWAIWSGGITARQPDEVAIACLILHYEREGHDEARPKPLGVRDLPTIPRQVMTISGRFGGFLG
jgi:hypothetical protein